MKLLTRPFKTRIGVHYEIHFWTGLIYLNILALSNLSFALPTVMYRKGENEVNLKFGPI